MNIPPIENAFAHICSACERKLAQLYPAGIPAAVQKRCSQELAFLEKSEYTDDFEIFRLLSDEARKCAVPFYVSGTVSGSFLYYLLGYHCFNPLPAHYYCPECGYYEEAPSRLYGIDLPEKTCPECGKTILADGFNLSPESVWGNDGKKILSFEYRVSSEFLPFARRMLTKLYPSNSVVPWGMFQMDPGASPIPGENNFIGVGLTGYAILPSKHTLEDYPDLISCLENGDPCVTGGGWELRSHFLKPVYLIPLKHAELLLRMQRATGIYIDEISLAELKNIEWNQIYHTSLLDQATGTLFHEAKPRTYREMAALLACSRNSYTWIKPEDKMGYFQYQKMTSSPAFQKYPCFTRDDFFECLLEEGAERAFAFEVSERIRKGQANPQNLMYDKFKALPIPEELKEVAENYQYLFPRSHCIWILLQYARLAYYARADRRAFAKIALNRGKTDRYFYYSY